MATIFQRTFAGGEIDPLIQTRADQQRYQTGLSVSRNAFIGKSGAWVNRAGTQFVTQLHDMTKKGRLIPYDVGNADGNFMLLLEEGRATMIHAGVIPGTIAPGFWINSTTYYPGMRVNRRFAEAGGFIPTDHYYTCIKQNLNQDPKDDTTNAYWTPNGALDVYIPLTYTEDEIQKIQFVQNQDALSLVHPNHLPLDIVHNAGTTIDLDTWSARNFPDSSTAQDGSGYLTSAIKPPTGVSVSPGGGNTNYYYVVTAISSESYEESLPSAQVIPSEANPDSSNPKTLSWTAVTGAYGYNVYRNFNGRLGLLGTTTTTGFKDSGLTSPDYLTVPPEKRTDIVAGNAPVYTGTFPAVVGTSQQRLILAATQLNPDVIWASRTGLPKNFIRKFKGDDSESSNFRIFGRKRNNIKHVLELGKTFVFTEQAEYSLSSISRTGPNDLRPESFNGSGDVAPIAIGTNALYIQAGNSLVRELGYDGINGGLDGFKEGDLTAFAGHLFRNRIITSWTHQQRPDSVVWASMDDGRMIALTYLKEQGIIAWSRHDTDGFVENLCALSEGAEHSVYMIVRRLINGVQCRYVERMPTRYPKDPSDYLFLDCSVVYQDLIDKISGITISGGVNWDNEEDLILQGPTYSDGEIGNFYQVTGTDGTVLRLDVRGSDAQAGVLICRSDKPVPPSMRNVSIIKWRRAATLIGGLSHLEGKTIAATGDGFIVASPNNPTFEKVVVTGGTASFKQPAIKYVIGLPYVSDLETLDVENLQGETFAAKKMNVSKVTLALLSSAPPYTGNKLPATDGVDGLTPMRPQGVNYTGPAALISSKVDVNINSNWANGRVVVRNVDPLPCMILGIAPTGLIPYGGS